MSDKFKLALELFEVLSKATDKLRKVQAKQMFEQKLTAPQFSVLEVIHKHGSLPLKKISEELMVTGANITCVIDNLEKENYVKRVPSNEDRRVINAELTSAGRSKIDSILPTYTKNISDVFSPLNENEQKELIRLLSKIL
ncbi:MAG: MarR family transcriptional regulator [Melioribacteraceae bacterium]|nr:MarR family transcriptional regulator [Melioribacteraceae bacterium]